MDEGKGLSIEFLPHSRVSTAVRLGIVPAINAAVLHSRSTHGSKTDHLPQESGIPCTEALQAQLLVGACTPGRYASGFCDSALNSPLMPGVDEYPYSSRHKYNHGENVEIIL